MKPIVISSQRSGLNFLRVCIESLTGQRTPGKALLVEESPEKPTVFIRTHDAANFSGKGEGAWKEVDPDLARGRKIVILIRNPYEIFGRELKKADQAAAWFQLELYASNLNRFCSLEDCTKSYFYYEDFSVGAMHMTDLIHFMDITASDGRPVDLETVEKEWIKLQETGRDLYDVNQKRAGGSMSRNAEDKLSFHQAILSEKDKALVVEFLEAKVSESGKAILARYVPSFA
ncbi:MAG: hypothetical protein ABI162_16420 [Luteolibacter sp.]